jgi:hypothetical protein
VTPDRLSAVREISGENKNYGLPVYVIIRGTSLFGPFMTRGYVRGMRLTLDESHPPMREFFIDLLTDFSTDPATTR